MVSYTNLHDKSLFLLVFLYRTKRHVFKPDIPVNVYPYFKPRTVSVGPLHLSVGNVDRRKNYGGGLNIEVSWYNLN